MTSADFQNRVLDRWNKYKGKIADFDTYKERYENLFKNREKGKITEQVFEDLMGGHKPGNAVTIDGKKRYFDNVLDDVAREIKSGKATLAYKNQLDNDIKILKNTVIKNGLGINKMEWHCFDGADDKFKDYLKIELLANGLSSDAITIIEYTIK